MSEAAMKSLLMAERAFRRIDRLRQAMRKVADDADTNSEAVAYLKNALADDDRTRIHGE